MGLVRLVEEEQRWEAPDHPQSVLPQNWGGIEPNRTVSCIVLKTTDTDRHTLKHFAMMNFVGFDLAFADRVALATQQSSALATQLSMH
ncbi:hypothetical protein TNCV_1156801 [Trichonephila clavipes]|nr:hypothetical protein TNCV_1156801 [Trichonephila clavipes]